MQPLGYTRGGLFPLKDDRDAASLRDKTRLITRSKFDARNPVGTDGKWTALQVTKLLSPSKTARVKKILRV